MEVPKLPTPLLGTYRTYKKKTTTWITWLATMAKKNGTIDHLIIKKSRTETSTGGRPKGKARKMHAKSAAVTYEVPLRSIGTLANMIVSGRVSFVDTDLTILRYIISARKECAAFYKDLEIQGADNLKDSNDRHQHFISVLEIILGILSSNMRKQKNTDVDHTDKGDSTDKKPMADVFACPDLATVPESEDNSSADLVSMQDDESDVYNFELSPENKTEETAFAIFCLLKDMTEIRIFVHYTWREYNEHRVAITTAAATMNVSFETLRRVNAAFLEDQPDYDDHDKIIQLLCNNSSSGVCENCDTLNDHLGCYVVQGIQLTTQTFSCENTWRQYFRDYLLSSESVVLHEYNVGIGTLSNERSEVIRSLEFMTRNLVQEEGDQTQTAGERNRLVWAIATALTAQKSLSWVVFAVQILIDMRRELGSDLTRGLRELRDTKAWLLDICQEHLEFECTQPISDWTWLKDSGHLNYAGMVDELRDRETAILEDATDTTEDCPLVMDKDEYLKQNPMLCGLIIQQLITMVHGCGIRHARHGRILVACHLYSAGQQSGYLKAGTRWADMEYLIKKQGESYMFVGDRPKTMSQCSVQLRLASGISLIDLSREKTDTFEHGARVQITSREPRHLKFFSAFDRQFERPSGGFERVASDPIFMIERMVMDRLQELRQKNPLRSRQQSLSPLQTLTAFKNAMKGDELAVRFDVCTLNTVSIQLIRAIQSHYQDHKNHVGDRMFAQTVMELIVASGQPGDPELSKVWSLVQEVIDNIGNHSYLNAGGNCNILHLARDLNWEKRQLPTETLLAGSKSSEHPDDWHNVPKSSATQLLASTPDLIGKEEGSACTARKIFLQKLKQVTLTGDPIKSIAGLP